MSCRTERPRLPAASSTFVCLATSRSVGRSAVKFCRFEIEAEGAHPRRVDRCHERVVARLLDQEATVLGEHPAGTPGDVVMGDAVDVGNVVSVAEDRDARMRDGLDPAPGCVNAEPIGSGLKSAATSAGVT